MTGGPADLTRDRAASFIIVPCPHGMLRCAAGNGVAEEVSE
jgi:hypothetical protein